MRRALAIAILACGCGRGVSVTVVTVDARPAVHGATSLSVDVGNEGSTLTQSFDLHEHPFPATFSVTTPGRTGDITFTAHASDDSGAVVGVGTASTTIVDNDESTATLLLEPADFPVNTQVAGAQRTVFYTSTGGRQITSLADGTWTVAWSDDCGTLGRCDEWGRRFDDTGTPLSTQIAAGTTQFNFNRTDIFGTDAALASGSDGSVLAVWTTWDEIAGDPGDIVCSAIAPDGSAASPTEVTLSTGTSPDHAGIAAFQDLYAVVWQENEMGSGTQAIQLRFVDKTCTPQSGVLTLSTGGGPDQPTIAAADDGKEAAVLWRAGSTIRGRFITGSSALGVESTVLTTVPDLIWGPELSPADGGYALVYWHQTAAGPLAAGGLVLHRLKEGGGDQGVETVLATTAPDQISVAGIAHRSDGALAVTWHDCTAAADGAGCGVLAQVVRPTGLPVGAPMTVNTTTPGDQTDPSITALPDAFAAVWTDDSMLPPDQSETGIRARVLYPPYDDAHGILGAPCSGSDACDSGLVCATGSDGSAHCHASCDLAGSPPLCPLGGACTQEAGGAACIF